MNRITECSNPHTDDEHAGSAKRDMAVGVAGLDSAGHLLSKASKIFLAKGASEEFKISERNTAEDCIRFERLGANNYKSEINESSVYKRVQTESMKDAINGIAGLDAAAKLLQAQMPNLLIQSQTPQVLTGAGAVSLTTAITHLVTASGADAVTLADGVEGQHKTIVMKTITTGGDTSIITPTHFANGSTITGNSVGDIQNIMFTNGAWHWTGGRGAVIA